MKHSASGYPSWSSAVKSGVTPVAGNPCQRLREGFLLIAICAVFLLTGCGSTPPEAIREKVINVEPREKVHAVRFQNNSSRLLAGELESLQFLMADIRPMGIHQVAIEGDSHSRLDRNRLYRLEQILADQGVPPGRITRVQGIGLPGEVMLRLSYLVAVAPQHCPDWSKYSAANFYNIPHSNVGCATKTNLAAQVADPHDLLYGAGDVRIDGARSSVAIGRYRKIEPYGGAEQQNISIGGGS